MGRHPELKSKTKILTFIPTSEEDIQLAEDFRRLCNQDGLKAHDLMLEAFGLVFRVHHWPPGNPQLTLQTCLEKKTVSSGKCGFKDCDRLSVGVGLFVPKNQIFGLCGGHFRVAQGNLKVWRDLKYPLKR